METFVDKSIEWKNDKFVYVFIGKLVINLNVWCIHISKNSILSQQNHKSTLSYFDILYISY